MRDLEKITFSIASSKTSIERKLENGTRNITTAAAKNYAAIGKNGKAIAKLADQSRAGHEATGNAIARLADQSKAGHEATASAIENWGSRIERKVSDLSVNFVSILQIVIFVLCGVAGGLLGNMYFLHEVALHVAPYAKKISSKMVPIIEKSSNTKLGYEKVYEYAPDKIVQIITIISFSVAFFLLALFVAELIKSVRIKPRKKKTERG